MAPMLEDEEFYTVEEIAEVLRINRMTVHRLLNKGEIPYHQIGKVRRIRKEDFEAYLAKTRREGG